MILLCACPLLAQIGTIGGRVIDAATVAGLEKATVRISMQARRGGPVFDRSWKTESDPQGRFSFAQMEPGIYMIWAERDGFLRAVYNSGGQFSVVLGDSQTLDNLELKLVPPGGLTVRVLAPEGRPATGITVRVPGSVSGLTGRDGLAQINGLAPGVYQLEASTAESPDLHAVAANVRVEPGVSSHLEMRMTRERTFTVEGRVLNAVAGDALTFVRLVVPKKSGFIQDVPLSADGTFRLQGVAAGSYLLAAESVSGFPPAGTNSFRLGSLKSEATAVRSVEVTDRNLSGIVLILAPPHDVHGVVATENGAVCPLAQGVDTITHLMLSPEVSVASRTDMMRLNAEFTIPDVSALHSRVPIYYYGACYVKSIVYGGVPAVDSMVDFSGEGLLRILMAAAGKVTGSVADAGGKAPRRATISLIPKSGAPPSPLIHGTDVRGDFNIWGVPPGEYRAYAWEEAMDTPPSPDLLKAFADHAVDVSATAGQVSNVRLTLIAASESGKITGKYFLPPPARAMAGVSGIAMDRSGAPLTNTRLTIHGLRDATPESTAVTDSDGRFEFVNLAPGFYETPWAMMTFGEGQLVQGVRASVPSK